ncbi:MAG: RNA polymerase-binding protein DksA [Deltaproteobacteria bacterium]|nr:RNA polymerase-binding protein DksA [Deltaproteobacteria bacterium]
MDPARLDHFRNLLLSQLDGLRQEVDRTIDELHGAEAANQPDMTDMATQESDLTFNLRIRDRERKLITKIREALSRIEDGTYGICEACGNEISEKRLEARPVTTFCIDCKTREEEAEKRVVTKVSKSPF